MRRLRILDYFAILLSLLVVGVFSVYAYSGHEGTPMVDIQGQDGHWVYPLSGNRTLDIDGPLGTTVIAIKGDVVLFVSSPCPDKLCVRAPALTQIGEWNACLPNKVFVRITGKHEDKIDILSY